MPRFGQVIVSLGNIITSNQNAETLFPNKQRKKKFLFLGILMIINYKLCVKKETKTGLWKKRETKTEIDLTVSNLG